ncbi:MAG: hypothetical protein AB2A00_02325 [Myxococcota bacterium]
MTAGILHILITVLITALWHHAVRQRHPTAKALRVVPGTLIFVVAMHVPAMLQGAEGVAKTMMGLIITVPLMTVLGLLVNGVLLLVLRPRRQ